MAVKLREDDFEAKYQKLLHTTLAEFDSKVVEAQERAEITVRGKGGNKIIQTGCEIHCGHAHMILCKRPLHYRKHLERHLCPAVSEEYCTELKHQLEESWRNAKALEEQLAETQAELAAARGLLEQYERERDSQMREDASGHQESGMVVVRKLDWGCIEFSPLRNW